MTPQTIESLYTYASNEGAFIPPTYEKKVVYNSINPLAEIYRFHITDLINNYDIQALVMDPVLINIARNYLACEPIFDFPAMWWSTAYLKEPSVEAAQLYHFDMDRIKWLKLFFYLTDVTSENGPHCYIRGSHIPGTKPKELLALGYTRIPDDGLKLYYKPDDFKQVQAKAGAIFAGDTMCFHKGSMIKKGERLVLELQYTSSLFGAVQPKMVVKKSSESFRTFCKKEKRYVSNIHFND